MTDDQTPDADVELAAMVDSQIEERRGKVLMLRLAGATYATIAEQCEVSISTARKDYQLALEAHMEGSAEMRIARQSAVITDVLRANYPAMMNGDKDAAASILRALERESKLFGLDAPARTVTEISAIEFANESARLINRIIDLDPTTLKELTRVGYQPPSSSPARQSPLDVEEVAPGPDPEPERPGVDPDGDHHARPATVQPADPEPAPATDPSAGRQRQPDDDRRGEALGGGSDAPGDGEAPGGIEAADNNREPLADPDGVDDDLDGWSNL